MLEHYWGGHLHAGYYGDPPAKKEFKKAKNDMVDAMLHWGLEIAPEMTIEGLERGGGAPLRILDVGCGLGATMRQFGKRWPSMSQVTGITLSAGQARRGAEITQAERLDGVSFIQCDAMLQAFPSGCFDIVWTLECEPHIADKTRFMQEMTRVLKPGGVLIMGTWNVRDHLANPLTDNEVRSVQFLLDDWHHAKFVSIREWRKILEKGPLTDISATDWTAQTLPTWREAFIEPFRKPAVLFRTLVGRFGAVFLDGMTLLRFDRAFRRGLMVYGIFRARKIRDH